MAGQVNKQTEREVLRTNGHMPQLDSLRTFAALAVIASHYAPQYFRLFNWGYAGVFLFFVLSGFLITGILLRAREQSESKGLAKGDALKKFYLRRTLRIFPLYYAIVIGGILFSAAIRDAWPWHVFYALNLQMALAGKYFVGITGPFWSLAVEEQFYLVWPFLILFVPLRLMRPLLVTVTLAGPLSRLLCVALGASDEAVAYLPTSCLDALGLGALLALGTQHQGVDARTVAPLQRVGQWALVALALSFLLPRELPWAKGLLGVTTPFLLSCIFVWWVATAASGRQSLIGRALESRPLLYLGKISYGLYVFHILAGDLVQLAVKRWSIALNGPLLLLTAFTTTVVMASLSWFLFERPINNLKDKWSARIGRGPRTVDATAASSPPSSATGSTPEP